MEVIVYKNQPWPNGRYTRYRAQNACAMNAYRLTCDHDGLRLVKGYALLERPRLWCGHWWCVDEDDLVVDPSWKNCGLAYVGVEELDIMELSLTIGRTGGLDLDVQQIAIGALVSELNKAIAKPSG